MASKDLPQKTRPISHLRKRFNVENELTWFHLATAICLAVGIGGIRFAVKHTGCSVQTLVLWIVLPLGVSIALGVYTMLQTRSRMKRDGI